MTDPGRLFMFGACGLKPSRQTVSLFRSTGATGLLLLARNIGTAAAKTAAVLIRSSWDLDLCHKTMTVVDAAGYRLVTLEGALSRTLSRRKS